MGMLGKLPDKHSDESVAESAQIEYQLILCQAAERVHTDVRMSVPYRTPVSEFGLQLQAESLLRPPAVLNKRPMIHVPILLPGVPQCRKFVAALSVDDWRARAYQQSAPATVKLDCHGKIGKRTAGWVGTGFFIADTGEIATDYHLVQTADKITALLSNGKTYDCAMPTVRPTCDLVLLQVENLSEEKFPGLKLAGSAYDLRHGDPILMIGHPHGTDINFMSLGTFDRTVVREDYLPGGSGLIDFRPPDNPQRMMLKVNLHSEGGNSGSPVFNSQAEVVGILEGSPDGTFTEAAVTPVDDLKEMISSERSSVGSHNWQEVFLPRRLHFGEHEVLPAFLAGIFAVGNARGFLAKEGLAPSLIRQFGQSALPGLAGYDLVTNDFPFLGSSLKYGTVAEKVTAGVNVAADLMTIGGGLASWFPGLRRASVAIELTGVTLRLGGDLLSERKYF